MAGFPSGRHHRLLGNPWLTLYRHDLFLVFCNVTNKILKRTDTAVVFTQEYFRVSYPLRNMSTLSTGSGSSKDTHAGVEKIEERTYANTYNRISIRRGTSREECRQTRHFPDSSLLSSSSSTPPSLPKHLGCRPQAPREKGELRGCNVCVPFLYPPPFAFIGGSHGVSCSQA